MLVLLLSGRELVEIRRLLNDPHCTIIRALLARAILYVLVIFTDGVTLELVDSTCDRLDLNRVLHALVHDHFVACALRCRRVRVSVHAHELLISFCSPLA